MASRATTAGAGSIGGATVGGILEFVMTEGSVGWIPLVSGVAGAGFAFGAQWFVEHHVHKGPALVSLGIAPGPATPPQEQTSSSPPSKAGDEIPVYDMPFDEAIEHCLKSGSRHISWGYEKRPIAERRVAQDIISEARKGEIRICGVPPGGTHPVRIAPCTLKTLEPVDGVFPKSPETPEGYSWILDLPNHPIGQFSEAEDTSYRRLRVDSRDIYRLWPKQLTSPLRLAESFLWYWSSRR